MEYRAGYKWMPTGPSFPIDNKAIRKLTHNYLDSFYKAIKSGKVYDTIAKNLREI